MDAVFLINPNWDEFRAFAQRSVYFSWKDGGALPWSRSFAKLWVDRLGSLGIRLDDLQHPKSTVEKLLGAGYERLEDHSVARIGPQARLDYWIVDKDHPTAFKTVYQSRKHKVVESRMEIR